MKKNIDVSWGGGGTDLFLAPSEDGTFQLLDYEYDLEKIHEICGGRCYYQSRSGNSGAGYIERWASLTKVGYYRVDTAYNDSEFQYPEKIDDNISIMLPYATHESDKRATLTDNPVVIMIGGDTIIYCAFYANMTDVLKTVLAGKSLEKKPSVLSRQFVDTSSCWTEEIEIKFYNFFGRSFYPWEFANANGRLKKFELFSPGERLYEIFHFNKCEDGTLVNTTKIGQTIYAKSILWTDPLENLKSAETMSGWEFAETNMVYRLRKNEVYVVGWQLAKNAYEKIVKRLCRFIPLEANEFRNYVTANMDYGQFVEFEITVPKILFYLNPEKQFENVRKGIAKKVREDVFSTAKLFLEEINDKKILEAFPDDMVIKIEDSWESGNCKPGTQAFVNEYFPGQTQIEASELKKYAENNYVMRIFRYIAKRDKIV